MRALAEFIMKGRLQALAVAGLGVGTLVFAWVGVAAAVLVLLRKGLAEGAYVVFWALLPAIAVATIGADVGPLTMLLGASVTALVLRNTQQWASALITAVAVGLFSALLLLQFANAYLASVLELVQPMLKTMQASAPGTFPEITTGDVAALIGVSTVLWSVLAVMLARWWQSLLYNPGGFRVEMWQLRLSPTVMIGLVAVMLLLSKIGGHYRFWAIMCVMPIVIAGLALIHGVVGRLGLGRVWLIVFYVALFILQPLWVALILAAIVDSWIDIRRRLPVPPAQ
ncbi:Uncharacterised protein [Zhongshania aliphaticivorans]|uniref:DUF2232 domain-containing protein n=1 Tax=Zhongshania aliphaticivorans TaxID=1470434 RepID=A0A5S9MYQ0_9GAMM|nr:hypothetical protein [Zhongshania aliphaticivorans]CAA0082499.1 Uncharacterised protein [Zhongshania aliphaticivorans]CAA0084241.1 Uncharacterised protein [Zhongshania aliphaticivorans]